jgi:hypothetical protein
MRVATPSYFSISVGQAVPRRFGGEGRDVFVGDLRRHPREVTGLLLLTDAGGRSLDPVGPRPQFVSIGPLSLATAAIAVVS